MADQEGAGVRRLSARKGGCSTPLRVTGPWDWTYIARVVREGVSAAGAGIRDVPEKANSFEIYAGGIQPGYGNKIEGVAEPLVARVEVR